MRCAISLRFYGAPIVRSYLDVDADHAPLAHRRHQAGIEDQAASVVRSQSL